MMMNHPSNEELFAYRDGELETEKRGLIEAHVLSCGACQARIDDTSDAEGMLRQGLQDPSDAYFEKMTGTVMGRVTGTAPAAAASAAAAPSVRAAEAAARPERAPRRKSFDDGPRNRAPGLPWPAILSAASAAAAVMVVVVMLVQRQDVWRKAPAPETVGMRDRAEAPAAGSETEEDVAASEAPPAGLEDQTKESADSPRANATPEGKKDAGKVLDSRAAAPSIGASGLVEQDAARRGDEIKTESASEAVPEVALRKRVVDPAAPQLEAKARDQRFEVPSAVPTPSGFAEVARRHGLPLLYDPTRVTGNALLRAEPDLRLLYQTGGSGEDSARVRLYLAEAARERAAGSYDAETFDTIVHHYRRAMSLARDIETSRMVRRRLEDFVSQNAPEP